MWTLDGGCDAVQGDAIRENHSSVVFITLLLYELPVDLSTEASKAPTQGSCSEQMR